MMAQYPEVFKSFPFERGYINKDVIRTRVGSFQRRDFDSGIADQQHLQDQFLSDFYCAETILTDNTGVFEWLDICESVSAAKHAYTFVELGAGYARWAVIAFCLATRFRNLEARLVCVEPEPMHYQWALQNLRDNDINPQDHIVLEGAVAEHDGYVVLDVTGEPSAWYGQSIIRDLQPNLWQRILLRLRPSCLGTPARKRGPGEARKCVRAYSLKTLLEPLDSADLIHIDVQGSEYEVLTGSVSAINEKVKRLHIGTHNPTIEASLQSLLSQNGWTCLRNYPGQGRRATEFGEMDFEDGIQTWINHRLAG